VDLDGGPLELPEGGLRPFHSARSLQGSCEEIGALGRWKMQIALLEQLDSLCFAVLSHVDARQLFERGVVIGKACQRAL